MTALMATSRCGKITGGDIVGTGVAEDHRHGVFVAQVAGTLPNDDGEFGFVFYLFAERCQVNGGVRPNHGAGWFQEEERFLGNFGTMFSGVGGIVAPNTHDFGRAHWGKQAYIFQGLARECEMQMSGSRQRVRLRALISAMMLAMKKMPNPCAGGDVAQ